MNHTISVMYGIAATGDWPDRETTVEFFSKPIDQPPVDPTVFLREQLDLAKKRLAELRAEQNENLRLQVAEGKNIALIEKMLAAAADDP